MRSGNGRHRRPRQAPAVFVTAGVTGAGLAMPLLAASGAQAADTGTWDRVAQCESGGRWSADTGNGYFGGLQLTQKTWEKYGGRDYAPRADLASRAQQIAVAERVLEAEGPEAWPSCATNAGLTEVGEPADVNPGDPVTPESLDSADSDTADARSKSRGDKKQGQTGKHRGLPSEEGQDAEGDKGSSRRGQGAEDREGGRHASRDGGSGRTGQSESGRYTVRPGDNLSEIAKEHSLAGGWPALYDANGAVVGDDPDLIRPGQHINLGKSKR